MKSIHFHNYLYVNMALFTFLGTINILIFSFMTVTKFQLLIWYQK